MGRFFVIVKKHRNLQSECDSLVAERDLLASSLENQRDEMSLNSANYEGLLAKERLRNDEIIKDVKWYRERATEYCNILNKTIESFHKLTVKDDAAEQARWSIEYPDLETKTKARQDGI